MSDKIEPIFHKMTEAIPPTPDVSEAVGQPQGQPQGGNAGPLGHVDKEQHNTQMQPDERERLIGIGRGQDTKGRGSQMDAGQ